ncbi:zinc-binding oxidoreductase ToxD [Gloeopeniophorella convolvens]|nr:zinc-binding oxidoreductase ToxD [Gloeopeniophorella convolvens]
MAPLKQKAVIIGSDLSPAVREVDVPRAGPGEILIKVVTAAANPMDWKAIVRASHAGLVGAVMGVDFAGVVEELGPGVSPDLRYVGERVCGFVHGDVSNNGAFSQYLVASAEYGIIPIPSGWSFEDAAQIGAAGYTTIQCLYESHQLPTPLVPIKQPTDLLVYGGSTAMGIWIIQFAKLAGLRVIATASGRNFELLRSLGADDVFDYRDPDVSVKIKALTNGNLSLAVDTISEGNSSKLVSDALSDDGGFVAALLPCVSPRENVIYSYSLIFTMLGKSFKFPTPHETSDRDRDRALALRYSKLLSQVLLLGRIKPIPSLVLPRGLASVEEGLSMLKDGKISAQKVVIRIADTPE